MHTPRVSPTPSRPESPRGVPPKIQGVSVSKSSFEVETVDAALALDEATVAQLCKRGEALPYVKLPDGLRGWPRWLHAIPGAIRFVAFRFEGNCIDLRPHQQTVPTGTLLTLNLWCCQAEKLRIMCLSQSRHPILIEELDPGTFELEESSSDEVDQFPSSQKALEAPEVIVHPSITEQVSSFFLSHALSQSQMLDLFLQALFEAIVDQDAKRLVGLCEKVLADVSEQCVEPAAVLARLSFAEGSVMLTCRRQFPQGYQTLLDTAIALGADPASFKQVKTWTDPGDSTSKLWRKAEKALDEGGRTCDELHLREVYGMLVTAVRSAEPREVRNAVQWMLSEKCRLAPGIKTELLGDSAFAALLTVLEDTST